MNEYYGYQQNDYLNYLMHYGKGQEAKVHKYLYKDSKGNYVYQSDKYRQHRIPNPNSIGVYKPIGGTSLTPNQNKASDRSSNQKSVKPSYGYHVRAKQINAHLGKQDRNFVTVNGRQISDKRDEPFVKAVRKSNKLKSNTNNESYKQFAKGTIRPSYGDTKAKAKSLISNSKTSRFDSLLNKLSSGKSRVSALLNTSMKALRGAGSTVRRKAQSAAIKLRNRKDQNHEAITWFTQPKQKKIQAKDFTITTRIGYGTNRKRGAYASRKSR